MSTATATPSEEHKTEDEEMKKTADENSKENKENEDTKRPLVNAEEGAVKPAEEKHRRLSRNRMTQGAGMSSLASHQLQHAPRRNSEDVAAHPQFGCAAVRLRRWSGTRQPPALV